MSSSSLMIDKRKGNYRGITAPCSVLSHPDRCGYNHLDCPPPAPLDWFICSFWRGCVGACMDGWADVNSSTPRNNINWNGMVYISRGTVDAGGLRKHDQHDQDGHQEGQQLRLRQSGDVTELTSLFSQALLCASFST